MITTVLPLLLLLAPLARADICYDYYNRPYNCNRNGLSNGARIGIGIGIAVGVLLLFSLCGYWRRRNLQKQWAKYRPPALPTHGGQAGGNNTSYSYGQGNNPYANNPPPPTNYHQQSSFAGSNPYGQTPSQPQQTYQPSMAGAYGAGATGGGMRPMDTGTTINKNNTGAEGHQHGYEWEQAREAERLEREQAAGEQPPPGYDVSANNTGASGYAPPTGPPPSKRT